MNFIEDLYYGKISPWEMDFRGNPGYEKLINQRFIAEEKLRSKMKKENIKAWESVLDMNDDIMTITNAEFFKAGFSLGVKMMAECLGE